MAPKTVLILGGGVGGIVAANELARRLGPEHSIILVDRDARHDFPPSFLWVMVGARRPPAAAAARRRLLHRRVQLVQAEVTQLDLAAQKVRAGERELPYDYLVLALGAGLAPERVPGLAGAFHTPIPWTGPPASGTPSRLSPAGAWPWWWPVCPSSAPPPPTRRRCS